MVDYAGLSTGGVDCVAGIMTAVDLPVVMVRWYMDASLRTGYEERYAQPSVRHWIGVVRRKRGGLRKYQRLEGLIRVDGNVFEAEPELTGWTFSELVGPKSASEAGEHVKDAED